MKNNIAEVTRPDGNVEYFERSNDGGYFPVGGGFHITAFGKGSTVRMIDAIPETLQNGFCSLDDGPMWKCLCNPNDRWNGWAKPFIYASEIESFLKTVCNDDFIAKIADSSEDLTIIDKSYSEEEPTVYSIRVQLKHYAGEKIGVLVYDLSELGFVFDFYSEKP